MKVFDDTVCALGEGPLWHPLREQLFWFDINANRLHTREGDHPRHWQFDEHVTAGAWVDGTQLLIASETRLFLHDVENDRREDVHPLEADNPGTRSNDGRADPWGGFWIGTMSKHGEKGAGAIYRYHHGDFRQLYAGISTSNAICFSPDRRFAYYTDTPTQIIRRQPLDAATGWPEGAAEDWVDLRDEGWRPDGAVTDAEGNLWNAQYGGARVACYAADGRFLRAVELGAEQATCPAFGGPGLGTLYCTSAAQKLSPEKLAERPESGMTFALEGVATGLPEPRVIL